MSERIFNAENHEYRIIAMPLANGGWTTAIIQTVREGAKAAVSRHDSNLRHESEEEALLQGEVTAKHMASKLTRQPSRTR